VRGRRSIRGMLSVLILVSLAGCMGPWFGGAVSTTVYLGEPEITGQQGTLTLWVAGMPDGGVAAIHVQIDGLVYDGERISGLAVEGCSDFVVTNSQFADGEGGFLMVNLSGVEAGPVARLTFTAHGNVKDGDVQLVADRITLVSDAYTFITDWKTPAYYAR
jgi:hypothetical protein